MIGFVTWQPFYPIKGPGNKANHSCEDILQTVVLSKKIFDKQASWLITYVRM